MRILQLIDSLEIGGAERMAVSFANALQKEVGFSALVATRAEGKLREFLDPSIHYLFLHKKQTIDWKALRSLKQFCRSHQITHIQAHSTSYATAVLLKTIYPAVQIIWHNHYGNSLQMRGKRLRILQWSSRFFHGMIACNQDLLEWGLRQLSVTKALYLPNFTDGKDAVPAQTTLHGVKGKRVLLLGNLRPEKNHKLLLEAALALRTEFPDWTYHLVGNDLQDAYSQSLRAFIEQHDLAETVYLYGSRPDSHHIIQQATIATLTSKIEGLPVALLEYGYHAKAVVVTAVGEIPAIVYHQKNGFLASPNQAEELIIYLRTLMRDEKLRNQMGNALKLSVTSKYDAQQLVSNYIKWLQTN